MLKLCLINLMVLQVIAGFAASARHDIKVRFGEHIAFNCCYVGKVHIFHAACHREYVEDCVSGRLDKSKVLTDRKGLCFFCAKVASFEAHCSVLCDLCNKNY